MKKSQTSNIHVALTVLGRPRSKKNNKIISTKHGYPRLISSKEYQAWERSALIQIPRQYKDPAITIPVYAHVVVYQGKGQAIDLTNAVEGLWDVLQKCRVVKNDYLIEAAFIRRLRDSKNPRIEVTLVGIDQYNVGRILL